MLCAECERVYQSESFLVESLGFIMDRILFVNKGIWISSFCVFVLFYFLVLLF